MAQGSLTAARQVAVDSTADELAPAGERLDLTIRNVGSVTCFIGPAGVTPTTGMELRAGEFISYSGDSAPINAIYAVTSSSSTTVIVQEVV